MYRARYGMYTPGRQICDSWSDSHSFGSNRDRRSVTKSALGGLMTIDWRESFSLKVAPDAANYGTTQWENEKAMLNVRYLLFLPLPLACPATLIISFPSETFLSHHYCPVVCFWKKKKTGKEFDAETWVFVLTVLQFASLFDFRRVLEGSIVAGAGFQIWKL